MTLHATSLICNNAPTQARQWQQERFVNKSVSITLHSRNLFSTVLLIILTIWTVQNATVFEISLFCEMCNNF